MSSETKIHHLSRSLVMLTFLLAFQAGYKKNDNNPDPVWMKYVWVADENTVWAVGYPNTLIQTNPGTQLWELKPDKPVHMQKVSFIKYIFNITKINYYEKIFSISDGCFAHFNRLNS